MPSRGPRSPALSPPGYARAVSATTRSRLAVLAVLVAAALGAFVLGLPAWPGPPIELCLSAVPDGVAIRARPSATGYLYVATESDDGRHQLLRAPEAPSPKETLVDLPTVPARGVVRLMFTKAPLDGPESAIFTQPDPTVPVAIGPAGVTWDGEATPAGCLVVPFAKRRFGYRYAIHLGAGV